MEVIGMQDELPFHEGSRYHGSTVNDILYEGSDGRDYLRWCVEQGMTFSEEVENEL